MAKVGSWKQGQVSWLNQVDHGYRNPRVSAAHDDQGLPVETLDSKSPRLAFVFPSRASYRAETGVLPI